MARTVYNVFSLVTNYLVGSQRISHTNYKTKMKLYIGYIISINAMLLRLSAAICNFTEFSHDEDGIEMENCDLGNVEPDLLRFDRLSVLELNSCGLHSFPNVTHLASSLRTLSLTGNPNITTISGDLIEPLVNLIALNLRGNRLQVFPDRPVQLPSLNVLSLAHNVRLTSTQITAPSLRILNILGNQWKSLHEVQAISLEIRTLLAHNNDMPNLDPSFERLFTKLERVSLGVNKLTMFPDFSESADTLISMDLRFNSIQYISKDLLSKFYNLKVLEIRGNQLKEFPDIWALPKVSNVNLCNNDLTYFPHITDDLPMLTQLDIGQNAIFYIPPLKVAQPDFKLLIGKEVDLCHCHNAWIKYMTFYNMSFEQFDTTSTYCDGQLWDDFTTNKLLHQCNGINADVKRPRFVEIRASLSVRHFLLHSWLPEVTLVECGRHCGRTAGCVSFYFTLTSGRRGECVVVAPTDGQTTLLIPNANSSKWYYYGMVY